MATDPGAKGPPWGGGPLKTGTDRLRSKDSSGQQSSKNYGAIYTVDISHSRENG